MKVRMVEHISGGRADGRPWPPYGAVIDVPDGEGRDLCAAQLAVPVAEPETAAETPEKPLEARTEARTAVSAPKTVRASRRA